MFPYLVAYVFAFAASGLFGPLVPAALLAVGYSAVAIANAVATQNVIRVIAPALWGQIADRSARPSVVAAASFAFAGICHVAIAYAGGEATLVLCYAALGLVGSAGIPIVDGLVLSALEDRKIDKARFGRVRVAGTFGFALSTLAVGVLRDASARVQLTPKLVLFPSAVLVVLTAVVLVLTRDPSRPPSTAGGVRFIDLAKNRAYLLILGFTFFHWASHATYTVFVVPLGEGRGLSPLVVAASIVTGLFVEALLMRRSGEVLGAIGGRKALLFVAAMAALRWVGFAIDFGAGNAIAFLFFSACHGLSFGFFYPVIVNLVANVVPNAQRHSALSVLVALAFGLGGAAGAAAAGYLLEYVGGGSSWLGMLPFSAAAFFLAWQLERSPALEESA